MQVLHKIPVFLRCRNCSFNCLSWANSQQSANSWICTFSLLSPLSFFDHFPKAQKRNVNTPFSLQHHFLCFLVFILFPAFLLVYNQSKVVLVFPPSASLNIKKTPKNNSLLFWCHFCLFRLMPEPILQKPEQTSSVRFAQSAFKSRIISRWNFLFRIFPEWNCLRIYHGTRFCFRQHFQVQYIDIFALNGIHSTTKDIAAIA